MRVLIDMNLSPRWAQVFKQAGIEAAHWSLLGPANATDATIMAFARDQGYVVLTHDLDFSAILAATGGRRPSVIQLRGGNMNPDAVAGPVIAAMRQQAAELAQGALLTIDSRRLRLRLLPLQDAG